MHKSWLDKIAHYYHVIMELPILRSDSIYDGHLIWTIMISGNNRNNEDSPEPQI
jgi:hypothetical protein